MQFGKYFIDLSQPQVMGILNVTPDSFSDGGKHTNVSQALDHALRMIEEGATFIDIGGESTRPGAPDVSLQEELDRTIPVIEAVARNTRVFTNKYFVRPSSGKDLTCCPPEFCNKLWVDIALAYFSADTVGAEIFALRHYYSLFY